MRRTPSCSHSHSPRRVAGPAVERETPHRDGPALPIAAWAGIVLGCAALALRPADIAAGLAVILAVGGIGALTPLPRRQGTARPVGRAAPLAVAGLGLLTFGVARILAPPLPTPPAAPIAVAATVLAAISEEALFRRLVYGWLAGPAPALAVVGAAALFAVVHVPAYGIRVLPLDFAAGLLLGWQRWATGGVAVPAATHAAANLLQLW